MACDDGYKLLATLDCLVKPGDTVLIKGARRMRMQTIADKFCMDT